MSDSFTQTQQYPVGIAKAMIIISVMLVAIIEVLDMTIVNVALPPMMGELGANSDQITWVLTSYVVSSAILMPLTGFIVTRIGQKRLLLINVIGFMITSALCGASTSLTEIVLFRTLQGIFGASLVPLSQFILRDTFPLKDQGKAMAIWGMGIMVAPVLGPSVGGYITEFSSWRWVFYINLPVCLLAAVLIVQVIQESATRKIPIDITSVFLMALGIGALQIFLDRGNQSDWFQSHTILLLAAISFVCLGLFVHRGMVVKNSIINFAIFKDRNFCVSTIILLLYVLGVMAVLTLRPMMMEHLMGYTALNAGMVLAPPGFSAALSMILAGIFMNRVNPKWMLLAGILITIWATYSMATDTSLSISSGWLIFQGCIQGFGMGLVFLIVSTLSLSTLKPALMAEGAGVFGFGRNLGISIGISILSTVLSRETQANWNQLGGHMIPGSRNLQYWLQAHHQTLMQPDTLSQLSQSLANQANMIAFTDCYFSIAVGLLALIPLVFLLKPPKELHAGAGH